MRVFSSRKRPVDLGPYPAERLARVERVAGSVPQMAPLSFRRPERPESLVNAMGEYQAMMDAIRDGLVARVRSECPDDPEERARHLKAFAHFCDAALAGVCRVPEAALLAEPVANPDIDRLAHDLRTRQTKTLASGIDAIMADLKESMEAPPSGIGGHTHALVIAYDNPRAPRADEPGAEWLVDALEHRACLRASETAVVLANYLRTLGFDAKAHTRTASDVCLNRLAVEAGLSVVEDGGLVHPCLGQSFGGAAVTTTFEMSCDRPLAPRQRAVTSAAWWFGIDSGRGALNRDPYARRDFVDGPHPFERLKRVETPTTHIDEPNVARVPKRTDMFARAQFGDLGRAAQEGAKGGYYARKAAPSAAKRRMLGAFVLLQDGPPEEGARPTDAERNAANVKAATYSWGSTPAGSAAARTGRGTATTRRARRSSRRTTRPSA